MDENYAEISQKKLAGTLSDFKIGNSWVSFYLNDVVTIRNEDWDNLEPYFNIPEPTRSIDFQKTTLKRNIIIPKEKEYFSEKVLER